MRRATRMPARGSRWPSSVRRGDRQDGGVGSLNPQHGLADIGPDRPRRERTVLKAPPVRSGRIDLPAAPCTRPATVPDVAWPPSHGRRVDRVVLRATIADATAAGFSEMPIPPRRLSPLYNSAPEVEDACSSMTNVPALRIVKASGNARSTLYEPNRSHPSGRPCRPRRATRRAVPSSCALPAEGASSRSSPRQAPSDRPLPLPYARRAAGRTRLRALAADRLRRQSRCSAILRDIPAMSDSFRRSSGLILAAGFPILAETNYLISHFLLGAS